MIPAYQPPTRYTSSHKPQRGRNKPLKATLVLTGLALFMAAATTVIVARTWNFYDALHISGWQRVAVQPGDTLTILAQRYDAIDNRMAVVIEIQKRNGLGDSSTIQSGQQIEVPIVRRNLP